MVFYFGEMVCDVEFEVFGLIIGWFENFEQEVNVVFCSVLLVMDCWVFFFDFEGLKVWLCGLFVGYEGFVCLVEIDGIDVNICGGMYLKLMCEVELMKFFGCEEMWGGMCVFWVVGGWVRVCFGVCEFFFIGFCGVLEGVDDEFEMLVVKKKFQVLMFQKELCFVGEFFIESWFESVFVVDIEFVVQVVDLFGGEVVSCLVCIFVV